VLQALRHIVGEDSPRAVRGYRKAGAVGATAIAAGADNASALATGAVTATAVATGAITATAVATGAITVAKTTGFPLTVGWDSGPQAITLNGIVTALPHTLGAQPKIYSMFLRCVSATAGYAVGEETPMGFRQATVTPGAILIPSTAAFYIRYGDVIFVMNKNDGTAVAVTTSCWNSIIRAYA
jgi:hypothetical protein